MIHKRLRRIGVTALLLNIILLKQSLFSKENKEAEATERHSRWKAPGKYRGHTQAEGSDATGSSVHNLQ